MSLKQAASFTKGLIDILNENKEDRKARTDQYAEKLEEIKADTDEDLAKRIEEFQEESKDYAKDMVEMNDKLNKDIQSLFKETYPDDAK